MKVSVKNTLKSIYIDRIVLRDLTIKDFQRRFAGAKFGAVWGILNPLLTMVVYSFVFQFAFKSADVGDHPFILWFLCALIPWLFFSEAFSMASNSFIEYSYLIKKVVFNVNILPLVKILSSAISHLFFIIILMIICVVIGYNPTIYWIQILYYFICVVGYLFAISLIFSSLIVFFRDLTQVISVILLIGMWGTPIAWNIDNFDIGVQKILSLNPIYYLVEGYRDSLLNGVWFWEKPELTLYFWGVTLILLLGGITMYNKLKPSFADVL